MREIAEPLIKCYTSCCFMQSVNYLELKNKLHI